MSVENAYSAIVDTVNWAPLLFVYVCSVASYDTFTLLITLFSIDITILYNIFTLNDMYHINICHSLEAHVCIYVKNYIKYKIKLKPGYATEYLFLEIVLAFSQEIKT